MSEPANSPEAPTEGTPAAAASLQPTSPAPLEDSRAGHGSWGNLPRVRQRVLPLSWRSDPLPLRGAEGTVLPYGLGRSYGDGCLNDGGTVLASRGLRRFIAFNPQTGIVRCEAGVTLQELLELAVPRGWFLPVTPGTQQVTVGGAIANDVHGKNHHRAGTFGRHVRGLELLRSDGERIEASPEREPGWFGATVGGLGLTGLITWAELQLQPIASASIDSETLPFRDLDRFFELSDASERDCAYTVAWIDCLAPAGQRGRGIFFRGNHADAGSAKAPLRVGRKAPLLRVPVFAPGLLLGRWTIRAFNAAFYRRHAAAPGAGRVHYRPFFYPLDAVGGWNKLYGRQGFYQYQCVVPGREPLERLLEEIARARTGSFLAVLKRFGDLPSPGLLSFPRPGLTLALDFPNRGARTLALFDWLDAIVREVGGAVYPAKDARMSAASFRTFFPRWEAFSGYVDPRFSSGFWRRVSG